MGQSKKILIITNIRREQPGAFLDVISQIGWQPTVVNLDSGDIFPSPTKYDALIVMGGPPSANDTSERTSWMPTEITRIKEALTEGIPYFGTCLGFQTLIKAAGGEIIKSPRKEVGFRETYDPLGNFYSVQLTKAGRSDPLFYEISDKFPVFHLHGETVKLSPTMKFQTKLLGTSDLVPNQIIKVGEIAYGTQGHFELTPQLLEEWFGIDPDLLQLGQQGIEQVRKDFKKIEEEYRKTATKLFTNFLKLIR